MTHDILPILEKLIGFKSITPEDDGCTDYVADLLKAAGFRIYIEKFGPSDAIVTNLYAVIGDNSPNLCFAGHIDVVPPGNLAAWKYDPFKMTIDGDMVYGRGTVDMKGAIACALAAVLNFLEENPAPSGAISFLLTSDEEGPSEYGTKPMLAFLKQQNILPKIDFCILGEPTCKEHFGDTVHIGRRGSVNFQLKIIGKQGHVAYLGKFINPHRILRKIIDDLIDLKLDDGTKFFDPSNLEITSIDAGNDVTNIVPESVLMRFNVRFNDLHSAKDLAQKIEEIVRKSSDNYKLTYHSSSSPFVQDFSSRMQDFTEIVKKESGFKPSVETSGGTSDARFIHHYAEVIECGLNDDMAHKIDESCKISDLQKLYNVYYASLVKYVK